MKLETLLAKVKHESAANDKESELQQLAKYWNSKLELADTTLRGDYGIYFLEHGDDVVKIDWYLTATGTSKQWWCYYTSDNKPKYLMKLAKKMMSKKSMQDNFNMFYKEFEKESKND